MKKLVFTIRSIASLMLLFVLTGVCAHAAVPDDIYLTGKTKVDNLDYSYDPEKNALTISGNGILTKLDGNESIAAESYFFEMTFVRNVERIILAPGITSIGEEAFCTYATEEIPHLTPHFYNPPTVTSIGRHAIGYVTLGKDPLTGYDEHGNPIYAGYTEDYERYKAVIHTSPFASAAITYAEANNFDIVYDYCLPDPNDFTIKDSMPAGTKVKAGGQEYKVINATTAAFTKAKNKKSVTVPATITANGRKFAVTQVNAKAFKGKKIRTVTIGKNVTKIKANAFKGSPATKLILKTKLLKKKTVKNALKGSKISTAQVKVGKSSANKKIKKAYKKFFTKKVLGRNVTLK